MIRRESEGSISSRVDAFQGRLNRIAIPLLLSIVVNCLGLSGCLHGQQDVSTDSGQIAELSELSELRWAIRRVTARDVADRAIFTRPLFDLEVSSSRPSPDFEEFVPMYAAEFLERSRWGHIFFSNPDLPEGIIGIWESAGYHQVELDVRLLSRGGRVLAQWWGLGLPHTLPLHYDGPLVREELADSVAGLRIQIRAPVEGAPLRLLADIPIFPSPAIHPFDESVETDETDGIEELRRAVRLEAAEFLVGSGLTRKDTALARLLANPGWQDEALDIDELVPLYARQILELSRRNTLFVPVGEDPETVSVHLPEGHEDRGLQLTLVDRDKTTLAEWWGFSSAMSGNEAPGPRIARKHVERIGGLRIQIRAPSSDGDLLRLVGEIPLFPWTVE